MSQFGKRSRVDRRSGKDRRSGVERRSGQDTRTKPKKWLLGERRSGKDRRSAKDRRKQYLISYQITRLYGDGRESVVRFGETVIAYDDIVDPAIQFEHDFERNFQSRHNYRPVLRVLNVEEVGTLAAQQ